jgi:hypothetical protein
MLPTEPIDQTAALAYASSVLRTISAGTTDPEDEKAARRAARMLDAIREDMD